MSQGFAAPGPQLHLQMRAHQAAPHELMTPPTSSSAPDVAAAANGAVNGTANGAVQNAANGASAGASPGGSSGASARYDVLEREGEGTMWVCYRARDRATGLVCALKALKSTFARHPRFGPLLLARLQAEAALRAPGQSLPHLAPVYEAGTEEGTPYFVTDWIPGGTLEGLLERGGRRPLNRSQALSIVRSLALALEVLHARGLSHGDIRPRQVRIMGDSSVKLSDSAHATALHEAGVQLADVLGDAALYQAPERWDNRPPSPGADLYAVGVVLFQMLAGRVPFEGTSPLSVAMRHRRDAPPRPSQFNAECPRDLETIALRLLEKDPAARYVSVAHLLRDLAAPPAPDTSTSPGTSTPAAAATAAAAPVAAAAPASSVAAPAVAPAVVDDEEEDVDLEAARLEEGSGGASTAAASSGA
jgi:serine/threonine-protein kinase